MRWKVLRVREAGERHSSKIEGGGIIKTVITPESVGSENFSMLMVFLHPGARIKMHQHAYEEVFYIVSGSGKVSFEGMETKLEKGMFAYSRPNVDHSIENIGDDTLTILACISRSA